MIVDKQKKERVVVRFRFDYEGDLYYRTFFFCESGSEEKIKATQKHLHEIGAKKIMPTITIYESEPTSKSMIEEIDNMLFGDERVAD